MTQISTYNGWSNRETWLVSLWLNNEPYTYEVLTEIADSSAELYEKSDQLKQFVYDLCMGEERQVNGQSASMATDLLNDAIETADYKEIISGAID